MPARKKTTRTKVPTSSTRTSQSRASQSRASRSHTSQSHTSQPHPSKIEQLEQEIRDLKRRNKELEMNLEEALDDYDELEKDYNEVKASRSRAKSELSKLMSGVGVKTALGAAGIAGTAYASHQLTKHLQQSRESIGKHTAIYQNSVAAVKKVVDALLSIGGGALAGKEIAEFVGDLNGISQGLRDVLSKHEEIAEILRRGANATTTDTMQGTIKNAMGL